MYVWFERNYGSPSLKDRSQSILFNPKLIPLNADNTQQITANKEQLQKKKSKKTVCGAT